jgi:hypothetical protein
MSGAVDVVEPRLDLVRDRARHARLAGARRTVEDDAARRGDAELLVDVRKLERQLHQLAHRADLRAQSAHVFERDVHRAVGHVRIGVLQHDLRVGRDVAGAVVDRHDLIGRPRGRARERQIQHRIAAHGRAVGAQQCGQVRNEIVRGRDVGRRQQLHALRRPELDRLDLHRFVEPRLECLAQKAIHARGIARSRRRRPDRAARPRCAPRSVATRTVSPADKPSCCISAASSWMRCRAPAVAAPARLSTVACTCGMPECVCACVKRSTLFRAVVFGRVFAAVRNRCRDRRSRLEKVRFDGDEFRRDLGIRV